MNLESRRISELQRNRSHFIRRLAYQYFWNDVELFERVLTHPVSWLVAGAPFLAECDRPARWSATNVGTLMNAKNNPDYFRADSSDDLASRLKPILQNEGVGKPEEMRKIELLLELILLQSYDWDREDDAANDRYDALADSANPLEYEPAKVKLISEIESCGSIPAVDEIITIDEIVTDRSVSPYGWWIN